MRFRSTNFLRRRENHCQYCSRNPRLPRPRRRHHCKFPSLRNGTSCPPCSRMFCSRLHTLYPLTLGTGSHCRPCSTCCQERRTRFHSKNRPHLGKRSQFRWSSCNTNRFGSHKCLHSTFRTLRMETPLLYDSCIWTCSMPTRCVPERHSSALETQPRETSLRCRNLLRHHRSDYRQMLPPRSW